MSDGVGTELNSQQSKSPPKEKIKSLNDTDTQLDASAFINQMDNQIELSAGERATQWITAELFNNQ